MSKLAKKRNRVWKLAEEVLIQRKRLKQLLVLMKSEAELSERQKTEAKALANNIEQSKSKIANLGVDPKIIRKFLRKVAKSKRMGTKSEQEKLEGLKKLAKHTKSGGAGIYGLGAQPKVWK